MQRSLTLAQRAVLERVREAGFPALAVCARECWSSGHPCFLPIAIKDPVLLAQFERANGEPPRLA